VPQSLPWPDRLASVGRASERRRTVRVVDAKGRHVAFAARSEEVAVAGDIDTVDWLGLLARSGPRPSGGNCARCLAAHGRFSGWMDESGLPHSQKTAPRNLIVQRRRQQSIRASEVEGGIAAAIRERGAEAAVIGVPRPRVGRVVSSLFIRRLAKTRRRPRPCKLDALLSRSHRPRFKTAAAVTDRGGVVVDALPEEQLRARVLKTELRALHAAQFAQNRREVVRRLPRANSLTQSPGVSASAQEYPATRAIAAGKRLNE